MQKGASLRGRMMPRILLVEDDPAVRQVLEDHLVEAGFEVVASPGTAAALEMTRTQGRFDLLLVDLVMPNDQPNGLAFAATTKARTPEVPVIFITGYYGFVARVGELPGTVLYKPVDLNMLTREIKAQLGA